MDVYAVIGVMMIAAAIFVFVRGEQKKRPPTSGWRINHSYGLPDFPTAHGDGWFIALKGGTGQALHYVQLYKWPFTLREGSMLTVKLRVTGGDFVAKHYPENPATMSIVLQRKRDNGRSPGYRYFSRDTIPLVVGEHTLTVRVDAVHFGDVIAASDSQALRTLLEEIESIGVMFGSDGGRGHGVYSTVPATIELVSIG